MKYLNLVFQNARRNSIRTFLTIASLTISLALSMVLISLSTVSGEVAQSFRGNNRIVVMSSQGFAQPVPYAKLAEIAALPGVDGAIPFSWYGGKYNEETTPFGQFGTDPDQFFKVYDDFTIKPDELKAWQADRAGCIVGRKLAGDRKLKVGDRLPLKDGVYPFNLNLTIRGIYDGPPNRDLRACFFHWIYLDEGLKAQRSAAAGNAGTIFLRVKDQGQMKAVCARIDESTSNSDTPTKSQSEEGFANMFSEMAGDFRWIIVAIGLAVGASLLCVAANSMAMALRERTTEVAVLKAIGFGKSLVIALILAESLLIAGIGGLFGSIGCKLFCDVVDLSKFTAGMMPFFYVPWSTAVGGLIVALGIGVVSGLFPAVRAARISVVNGLRKVV